jgi:PhzF family phenazine biosynthesis protein
MNAIPLYQVDAFAERPFEGNPAAVCLLPEARSESWMQSVAQEMNLSETAFVVPRQDGFDLRWYTPVREVELCGHATLASAHVLWEAGVIPQDTGARFHSKSGVLLAGQRHGKIWLDFPADQVEPADPPDGLEEALGIKPQYVGRGRFDVLVELESERDIRALAPRFDLFEGVVARGVITTARATLRLRLPILRTRIRYRRGSGHRIRTLHPGLPLVDPAGQDGVQCVPGVRPGRHTRAPAGR